MAHIPTAVLVLLIISAPNHATGLQEAVWGEWSTWFCSASCRASGFLVRTRNCDRPRESMARCDGASFQQSGACNTSHIQCPFECPDELWGVGCDKRCPFTCLGHRCDDTSGLCTSCREYHFGDRCQFRCPTGRYGETCEHECGHLCFRGCNLQTGRCIGDVAIYVVAIMTFGMASLLPAIFTYHEYLRAQDSTS
ncbi:hypothetical protein BsWGS_17517 [Bradybaena similaris]